MKPNTSSRRRFCREIALAGALAPLSSSAIGPIKRTGSPRLKLSLAAYSFRKQLTAKPGTPGAMDMLGFIDWAATQDLDAVEPTSYFFPREITPQFLAELKRRAYLHGLDISSGAIRNVFTLPDGPDLDKWHAHVETWIDHYAAIGCPIIRVFAGKATKDLFVGVEQFRLDFVRIGEGFEHQVWKTRELRSQLPCSAPAAASAANNSREARARKLASIAPTLFSMIVPSELMNTVSAWQSHRTCGGRCRRRSGLPNKSRPTPATTLRHCRGSPDQ